MELSKSFVMKDLGPTRRILGMKISGDRQNGKLWLSQKNTLRKYSTDLTWARLRKSQLHLQVTLKNIKQCPKSEKDKEDMKKIPYASTVGSLMYALFAPDQILLILLE